MKRIPISKKVSRLIFRKTASKPHPKNTAPVPMRGGIRLAIIAALMLSLGSGCAGCKTQIKDVTFGIAEAIFETK